MKLSLFSIRWTLILLSEILGFLIAFRLIILSIIQGNTADEKFIVIAFTTLELGLTLRRWHLIFGLITILISILILVILIVGVHKNWILREILSTPIMIIRAGIGFMLGYLLGTYLIYSLLNLIFYRGAFVTIPFLLGIFLFISCIGLVFTNPNLSFIVDIIRQPNEKGKIEIPKPRVFISVIKLAFFLSLSLLLIIPNLGPILGFQASPPILDDETYLETNSLFNVNMITIENNLPNQISDLLTPETQSGKWSIYLFLPKTADRSDISYPLAFYLHGFDGYDINYYYSSMMAIAQRGVIGVFVQYATTINLNESEASIEITHPSATAALRVRYEMVWTGIKQSISALQLENNDIGEQKIQESLGSNYSIDLSRLLIVGHSMGGGMVPYIMTRSLEQGWGSTELILDMEAPWYSLTWDDFNANYTVIPSYAIINVVTYEDDHLVSQCIGMDHFEKLRRRNGTSISDDQINFIFIQSDRSGFPRLVATHYLPIDNLDDSLHQFGYIKRIRAMAYYLSLANQGKSIKLSKISSYFIGEKTSDMGIWSDSKPVNPAIVTKDPYGIRGEESIIDKLQDPSNEFCEIQ